MSEARPASGTKACEGCDVQTEAADGICTQCFVGALAALMDERDALEEVVRSIEELPYPSPATKKVAAAARAALAKLRG